MRSSSVVRSQLFEACDLGLQRRLVAQVGIRRAAPESEALAQQPGRLAGISFARAGAKLLELVGVESPLRHAQQVAGGRRGERVVSERSAKPRDIDLRRLGGRGRRGLAPALADEPICRDGLVCVHEQHGQHSSLTDAAELGRGAIDLDLEGAEHSKATTAIRADAITVCADLHVLICRALSRSCSRFAAGISLVAARAHDGVLAGRTQRPEQKELDVFRIPLILGVVVALICAGISTAADGPAGRPDGRLLPDGADIIDDIPRRDPTIVVIASRRARRRNRWSSAADRMTTTSRTRSSAQLRHAGRHPDGEAARPRSTGSRR